MNIEILMYVFVSHSSKNNDEVQKIENILKKYNIENWIDYNVIDESVPIPSQIADGMKKMSHFFLVWSNDASSSKWVQKEIDSVTSPPYEEKTKIIILSLDDTVLEYPINSQPPCKLLQPDFEVILSKLIEEKRPAIDEQLKSFKEKIIYDYENFKEKKYYPVITNFRKFDGYKYYVSQDYDELSKKTTNMEDITRHVEQKILDKNAKIIPIVSEYGSGKSSLCHNILYKLCHEKDTFPIFIPLGDIEKNEQGYSYDSLKNEIFRFVQEKYHFMISKNEFEFKLANGDFIFILDALDEMSFKINDKLAQNNLEQIVKLSEKNRVLVTSRYNYISGDIEKQLIQHHKLLLLREFDIHKRDIFVGKKFPQDQVKKEEIKEIIIKNNIEEIANKPLFLDIICNNLERFQSDSSNKIINEATIMQILTNNWIKYDVQTKNIPSDKQETKIKYRQRCSEILAVAENRNNDEPISKSDIQEQVRNELASQNDAHLDEYFRDARDCTFLIPHENNSFKYILDPIKEYFVARRIVNDIRVTDYENTIYDIEKNLSKEIFQFILKIIEIEWGVQPHVFEELKIDKQTDLCDQFFEFENKSGNILKLLNFVRKDPKKPNVGALVEILHKSGNLPKQISLTGLFLERVDLKGADLRNVDLKGADLRNADLEGVDFEGVDLWGVNLEDAKLERAKFRGTKLERAKNLPISKSEARARGALI